MDRYTAATNIVIALNRYNAKKLADYIFIREVCAYFDEIKYEEISEADFRFLKFIANSSGIPHFFSILKNFDQTPRIQNIDLNTFAALLYEDTLHTTDERMLHKYQKVILTSFEPDKLNRYFLSASTSFGKTYLVFEVIKRMEYKNVALIFPTIALLSENFERLVEHPDYAYFVEYYAFHTLSEINELKERNIFIYTPERFLSYIEKGQNLVTFDFVFVDEIYKLDNDYIIDQEFKENERDVAYRLAVHHALVGHTDCLLAGPYMEFADFEDSQNDSFLRFLRENQIELIDNNRYEIVNKQFFHVEKRTLHPVTAEFDFPLPSSKSEQLISVLRAILTIGQNTIVYCAQRGKNGGVEGYAEKIVQSNILTNHDYSEYSELIDHLSRNFSADWIVVKALKSGIGIHHGLVPKFVQKEIVSLFNNNQLKILISTTTITEGVNTSAKNLIVMHGKKGNKDLKKFDAKNIAGRAGRFMHHYSGRVIDLSNTFMSIVNGEGEIMKHKNYDSSSPKDEIDLFYSDDTYLNKGDREKKADVQRLQADRNIPDSIMESFAVISRRDKIAVYDAIASMSAIEHRLVNDLIALIRSRLRLNWEGFQVVLKIIAPICNEKFKGLIDRRSSNEDFSILTVILHFYLQNGFRGSVDYYLSTGQTIDNAIRMTADFAYNTLKYQAVKYLGVFNLMYRYYRSVVERKPFEETVGLDRLLRKLEYNALTDHGRLASDFGVPSNVVEYYENESRRREIRQKFDDYELKSFNRIQRIINKNS